jgi:hypothetical protein
LMSGIKFSLGVVPANHRSLTVAPIAPLRLLRIILLAKPAVA